MTTDRELFLHDLSLAMGRERVWQEQKHGTIEERPHTVGEYLLIMERELLEAKEAWCTDPHVSADTHTLEEILQVITVGAACLEQHGIVDRFFTNEKVILKR